MHFILSLRDPADRPGHPAAAIAQFQQDVQADLTYTIALNGAAATLILDDVADGQTYADALTAAAAAQAVADAQAGNTFERALIDAAAAQMAAGAQADAAAGLAMVPLEEALVEAVADAWLAHSQAAIDADAALELAEVVARAAAISAWAAADGTPDPQLQADLASAEAALKSVILPAQAVFDRAVVTASRQWVAAINPAATQAALTSVGAGLTYTLSVIPELATLATTLAANALQATNDLIPLAVTLEQTLTDNAAAWVTTITPESHTAANEIADHTAQAQLTTSNALLTLTHQLTDNALAATTTMAAAEVTLTGTAGSTLVNHAAQSTVSVDDEGFWVDENGERIMLTEAGFGGNLMDGVIDKPAPRLIGQDQGAEGIEPSLEELSDSAIETIGTVLPGIIRFGTNTCERYAFALHGRIRSLHHDGITDIQVVSFALVPHPDAPFVVNLAVSTGHAAVRVTLADGRVLYFDNGFVGGDDQKFEINELPTWAFLGTPSLGITEDFWGHIEQGHRRIPRRSGINLQ